jgi:hypothetical protein
LLMDVLRDRLLVADVTAIIGVLGGGCRRHFRCRDQIQAVFP